MGLTFIFLVAVPTSTAQQPQYTPDGQQLKRITARRIPDRRNRPDEMAGLVTASIGVDVRYDDEHVIPADVSWQVTPR